jgi:uncharacterized protein (TIGR03382 family)
VAPGALGRALLVLAGLLALVGLLLVLGERYPWLRLGRLPGDISLERGRFRLYLPLGTSIVLSLALSALLWLVARRR